VIARCALALLLAASASKPPKRTARLLERGKAVYEIHCIACHGPSGEGDGVVAPTLNPKPRNFRTGKFAQGDSVAQIFATLGTGVPGTAMAKFPQLSNDDRWAVAYHVRELKQR
jgi:high-affinity iron transporter